MLEGAHEYDPLLYIHLVQDYGMETDVSEGWGMTWVLYCVRKRQRGPPKVEYF